MTPWLTVAIPCQPSQPERMARLGRTLRALAGRADTPERIVWTLQPAEGPDWPVSRKWTVAISHAWTEWVFLLADDVHALTEHWDTHLEAACTLPGVALLACDDGLFHERIAVYPCVNRAAVLPLLPSLAQYRFYRIDDHLTDVCRRAGAYGYLPRVQFYSAEVIDCVPYAPDPARCQTDHATYLRLAQARDREVDGLRAWREAIEAQTAAPAVAVS